MISIGGFLVVTGRNQISYSRTADFGSYLQANFLTERKSLFEKLKVSSLSIRALPQNNPPVPESIEFQFKKKNPK